MENTATIIFANGETITAQTQEDSFITEVEPAFPENLENITIVRDGQEELIAHGTIAPCASIDGRFWFTVREVPEQKRILEQMQANIQFIAMMSDIDLDD